MKDRNFFEKINKIASQSGRYPPDAYEFISDAVVFTSKSLGRTGRGSANKHISGKELIEGVKAFAVQQFGPLAGEVLKDWGIKNSLSIGEIVFSLVDSGILGKSPNDSIDDFKEGFDVDKDFSFKTETSNLSTNKTEIIA